MTKMISEKERPKEAPPGNARPPESTVAVIEGEFHEVRPVVTPEMAREARKRYLEMVEAVTGPEDYQTFTDDRGAKHKFRKRAGWKALEWAYGASVTITDERIFHLHNPAICLRVRMPEHFKDVTDCGCEVKGVRYIIRATDTRTGRHSENVGICVSGERRVPKSASLHDLATRAFNRGANRSTADLLGVSDPSAEEKQASSGYSKEERQELAELWKNSHPDDQERAIFYLTENGFQGKSNRELYVDLLMHGDDSDLTEVMGLLRGPLATDGFDPDDVPPMRTDP